jgi:hypothetical protein
LDVVAGKSKNLLVPMLVAGLLILLIVLGFFVHEYSVLRAVSEHANSTPILAAQPAAPATPVVASNGTPPAAPPVTAQAGTPPGQLPAQDLAYVNFLQTIETRRQSLQNNLMPAMGMMVAANGLKSMDDADEEKKPTQQINNGFGQYTQQWQALSHDFEAQSVPPDCRQLGNAYYNLLADYTGMILKIQVAMQNGDMGTLMGLQQTAEPTINQDCVNADGALGTLCNHYNATKPFQIQPESSTTSSPVVSP